IKSDVAHIQQRAVLNGPSPEDELDAKRVIARVAGRDRLREIRHTGFAGWAVGISRTLGARRYRTVTDVDELKRPVARADRCLRAPGRDHSAGEECCKRDGGQRPRKTFHYPYP